MRVHTHTHTHTRVRSLSGFEPVASLQVTPTSEPRQSVIFGQIGHFFPSYRQLYLSSFFDTHTHTHTQLGIQINLHWT